MPNEGANQEQAGAAGGQAEIRWGVYQDTDNYAGMRIGEVREQLDGIWNIPNDAQVYVGDQVVNNDYTIRPGDAVSFVRRSGEKGNDI